MIRFIKRFIEPFIWTARMRKGQCVWCRQPAVYHYNSERAEAMACDEHARLYMGSFCKIEWLLDTGKLKRIGKDPNP